MITERVECKTCGAQYVVALGYAARAPHGPKKNCAAPDGWRKIREDRDEGQLHQLHEYR